MASVCDSSKWPGLKLNCGSCKALVKGMSNDGIFGGKCAAFCAEQSLTCVSAYEETDNTCGVEVARRCDQAGKAGGETSSDLICECTVKEKPNFTAEASVAASVGNSSTALCDSANWPGVRENCGPCKALLGGMGNDGVYHGTCSAFCAEQGLDCVSQAEEVDNTCKEEWRGFCQLPGKQKGVTTMDLLCECGALKVNATVDAMATGVDRQEKTKGIVCDTSKWPGVKKVCGDCKASLRNMDNTDEFGGKCMTFCSEQGLSCVGHQKGGDDNCDAKWTGKCGDAGTEYGKTSKDLICECGLSVNNTSELYDPKA